jgi:hypothetical protein
MCERGVEGDRGQGDVLDYSFAIFDHLEGAVWCWTVMQSL